ncbi:MAG TPA: helix-turn-helix domain-containing protein [Mycobacterium sp.]|nr:helix-turn-helix domain-containing protein [Mycobacterium sp.]
MPGGRHFDVLRVLQAADEPMTIVQIADELGVHPNTVRFHLDALLEEGRVEHVESDNKGRGRPALLFRSVRQMDRGGTRHYRLLAEILTIGLAADEDASTKALAAGRAWGERLQQHSDQPAPVGADESIDQLVDMLDELGFEPERTETEGETRVSMRHCPFLELAESRADVVCPIHLGLMQGVLQTWGSPVAVDRLDAFAEPDLCLAHLSANGSGSRKRVKRHVRVEHSAAGQVRLKGTVR